MGALWDEWLTPPDAKTIKYKVRTIIWHYGYRDSDTEDLEQRLAIRAWKAMHKYDPTKGSRSTFLKAVLDNELANIIAHDTAQKRDRRKEESPDVADEGPLDAREEGQPEADRRLDIPAMIARLPGDLQPTARLLMLMSPAEVARQPGMTREKVRGRIARIERHFRELGWESK